MKSYSITFLLLFCFLQASSQSGLRIAKKEGIGVALVNWDSAGKFFAHPPLDNRLFSLGNPTPYICLEKNTGSYLLKCVRESNIGEIDSSIFQLKPENQEAIKLLTWDEYWNKIIEDIFNPDRSSYYNYLKLKVAWVDSIKYRILSTPNDSAKQVRCQNYLFADHCIVITGVKGEWLEVSVSMFDDCSGWIVSQEEEAHPEKYKHKWYYSKKYHKKIYRAIIAEKCFDKGWVRWKKGDECFLTPLLFGR